MNALPVRLRPGDDLRGALEEIVARHGVRAAFVVAGIGSLASPNIRLAGADDAMRIDGDVEILTLSGSVGPASSHLHVSVADAAGRVTGGHVPRGCRVRTTAEIVLLLLPAWDFAREVDAVTGFEELVVRDAAASS